MWARRWAVQFSRTDSFSRVWPFWHSLKAAALCALWRRRPASIRSILVLGQHFISRVRAAKTLNSAKQTESQEFARPEFEVNNKRKPPTRRTQHWVEEKSNRQCTCASAAVNRGLNRRVHWIALTRCWQDSRIGYSMVLARTKWRTARGRCGSQRGGAGTC
jgi:hypothetical protein